MYLHNARQLLSFVDRACDTLGHLPMSPVIVDLIPQQGQTFMVIGAAGDLPKPPERPVVFLEGE